MNVQQFIGTGRYDIYCHMQELTRVANQCRRYLLDNGDIRKINSSIKAISDKDIFWIFAYAFNPYCGAYDIVDIEIDSSEECIVKDLPNEKYLY